MVVGARESVRWVRGQLSMPGAACERYAMRGGAAVCVHGFVGAHMLQPRTQPHPPPHPLSQLLLCLVPYAALLRLKRVGPFDCHCVLRHAAPVRTVDVDSHSE